ncbi:type VI secretion system tip protein VgrG, partial [Paraburkholderia ferrariae]
NRTIKSAAFSRQGPSSLAQTVNSWKHAPFDEEFTLKWPFSDEPVHNQKFSIIRDDGSVIQGSTNAWGKTSLQRGLAAENVRLRIDGESA